MFRALGKRWRLLTAVVGCLALVSAAPMVFADDDVTDSGVEGAYAVFNTPGKDGKGDFAIQNHIIELIEGTPKGAEIYGSMFSWTRDEVAQALADAQARGVAVRLAIDAEGAGGTTNTDPDNKAIKTLKAAKLTQLVFCRGAGDSDSQQTGCIADREYSINHNKLFAFSKTGDMNNVVVSTSQNMTLSQNSLFNNAVVLPGDASLYQWFAGHFENLLAQKKDNDYFGNGGYFHNSGPRTVTAYASPRADSDGGTGQDAATDTYAALLNYITDQPGECGLDIVQASFTGSRMAVADELVRVANLGCTINLVYGSMGDPILEKLSGVDNISMKRYEDNTNDATVSVHSKYMVFHGAYNGSADRDIVFTGSQNLTGPSLRSHDEMLLKVEIDEVATAYRDNFTTVWDRAVCAKPSSGTCP